MRLIDWVNVVGIALVIIGGATYIGELKGRIDTMQGQLNKLDLDAISKAKEDAIEELMKLAKKPTLHSKIFHVWVGKNDSMTTEMIGVDEGFCYLTRVAGKFEGGGEAVWIDIKGGSWYLGAQSKQVDVDVRARCWKWPSTEKEDG